MKTRKHNFRGLDPIYQNREMRRKWKERMKQVKTKTVAMATAFTIVICGSSAYLVSAAQEASVNVQTVLNFRQEPSLDAPIIEQLSPDTLVTVLEDDVDGWTKIECHGHTGYVATQYIDIVSSEQDEEIAELDSNVSLELIAEATITASKSSQNRNYNMSRACDKINGIILQPGDIFAWYDVDKNYEGIGDIKSKGKVGPASKENGFKQANVISGGKYVTGYGGGVCQVSTALYNCIDQLGIKPIEHHHHTLSASYVEEGMDATVAYSEDQSYRKNFVFANMQDYPIKIMAQANGSTVVVTAYKVVQEN